MTKIPPRDTDWLEPPQWWKKVRPLRWIAGLVVILLLYSWLGPEEKKRVRRPVFSPVPTQVTTLAEFNAVAATDAPAPTPVVAEVAVATATPTAAPTPTPTPAPTVAPTAVPTAKAAAKTPAPAADTGDAVVYEEDEEASKAEESDLAEFTNVVADPVRLVSTFRSYATVDSVVFELERAGFRPMTETSNSRYREGVPPRDLTTVSVSQFRHWSVVGKLTLQFFNDRLYQSEFEPEDPQTYTKAQHRELPQVKSERSGRAVWVGGNLRIASSLDLAVSDVGQKLKSRPFLLWQEIRLVRQRDEWDRRFTLSAAKP